MICTTCKSAFGWTCINEMKLLKIHCIIGLWNFLHLEVTMLSTINSSCLQLCCPLLFVVSWYSEMWVLISCHIRYRLSLHVLNVGTKSQI